MIKGEKFKLTLNNLRAFILIAIFVWTGVVATSIYFDINREVDEIDDYSKVWARLLFDKNESIYRWSAHSGILFTAPFDKSQAQQSGVDSGTVLRSNLSPMDLSHQILNTFSDDKDIRWHISSQYSLSAVTQPDKWEQMALKAFDNGRIEYSGVSIIEGQKYYRYMKPLVVDESCIGCHSDSEMSVGGNYGGLSITVPYGRLLSQAREGNKEYIVGHSILWAFGLLCGIICYILISTRLKEKIKAEVELKKQAAFLMNSPSPAFQVSTEGVIIHINPAVLNLLGRNKVGEPINAVIPDLNKNRLNRIMKLEIDRLEQALGDKIYLFVVRYDRTTLSYYIYGSDISDLKKSENDLRNSKDLLALHIEQTPLAFIEWNTNLEVVDWNKAAENIFGYSKEEILGKQAFDIIVPEENVEVCTEIWQDLLKKSGGTYAEGTNLTKDGRLIYCNWYNTPLVDRNGTVVGIASLAQDYTSQREMEQSMRDSLKFLEILLETIPNPMFFKSSNGKYLRCNKAFAENILGLDKDDICGKTVYDFPNQILHELADSYTNADLMLINNPGHQEYEGEVRCSDGKTRTFQFNKATYSNDNGEVVGIVGVMHDLSEIRRVEKALRVSEIKFRNIFDNAQVGLFRVALADGKLLECNEKFAQIAGYRTVDDCMSEFEIAEHCVDKNTCHQMLTEVVKIGEIKNYEAQINGADSKIRWLRYSVKYFPEENFIQGVAADITQEKNAFEMIRKSNQKVINILASISDGFYTLDNNLNVTYFNLAAEHILECRGEDILGKNIFEIFPHFRRTIIYNEYLRAMDERKARAFEVNYFIKGREEWYDIRVYPNEEGVSVYFREITERKQFEQLLVDKEYRLRSIFNAAADGFAVIDKNGVIDSINPAALIMFGYSSEFVSRKNIAELIPDFMSKCFRGPENVYDDPQLIVHSSEFDGIREDGSAIAVKASISEMNLHSKQYYTVVIYDLTEEKENMRRLIEVDKFSSIGTLAAGVAHEFKNYLAGIIGNASYALEVLDNTNIDLARETFEQIVEIGESANKTAMSLLTYSRKNPQMKSRENVNTLISNVIKLVNKEALISEIDIVTNLGELPRIFIMPAQVQQMILNIILNALQAIGSKGRIEVSSALENGFVTIRISDNGCGIPEDKIGKIFDPFFSTKGVWGKDKTSGTGLGLSISRNIAADHNGTIEVESEVDRGATFTIRLQAVEYEHADEALLKRLKKSNYALFSVNEKFTEKFRNCCGNKNVDGKVCGSYDQLKELSSDSLLLFIDAQYPGLGELYRAADYCKQNKIDFILINTGDISEMQLQGLIDDALTIHADWPEFMSLVKQQPESVS